MGMLLHKCNPTYTHAHTYSFTLTHTHLQMHICMYWKLHSPIHRLKSDCCMHCSLKDCTLVCESMFEHKVLAGKRHALQCMQVRTIYANKHAYAYSSTSCGAMQAYRCLAMQ
jgi:hypothetical protein